MVQRTAFGLVVVAALAAGCARDLKGEDPPDHSFYFPASIATSLDGRFAYVLNSNFDLRFNAGWISVVDLDELLRRTDAGEDPRPSIIQQLRVPSLGAQIVVSPSGLTAVVTSRGTNPVTLVEISPDGSTLDCGDPGATANLNSEERKTDCDRAHLIDITTDLLGQNIDDRTIEDSFAVTIFDRAPDCGATGACDAGTCRVGCTTVADCPASAPLCVPGAFPGSPPGSSFCACDATSCGAGVACNGGVCDSNRCTTCNPNAAPATLVGLTYLSGPWLTLFELVESPPQLLNPRTSTAGAPVNTPVGLTELSAITVQPTTRGTFLAATSKQGRSGSGTSQIYSIDLGRFLNELPTNEEMLRSPSASPGYVSVLALNAPSQPEVPGVEMFDIAFTSDGNRAYALNLDRSLFGRSRFAADSVVILDTSIGALDVTRSDGTTCRHERPQFEVDGAITIEGRPQGLAYVERASDELLFVSVLERDKIYVLKAQGDSLNIFARLDNCIDETTTTCFHGEGPYQMHAAERGGMELVLVTTFFDHGVLVIDATDPLPSGILPISRVRNPDLTPSKDR